MHPERCGVPRLMQAARIASTSPWLRRQWRREQRVGGGQGEWWVGARSSSAEPRCVILSCVRSLTLPCTQTERVGGSGH